MAPSDDDKPPSVTRGAKGDAAKSETQPPSPPSPKLLAHEQREPAAAVAPKLSESAPSVASRSLIEAVEEKFLDRHADKGSEGIQPLDNSKPRKSRLEYVNHLWRSMAATLLSFCLCYAC
ncbi:hypothetical protein V8C26DRAFT_113514 [Trichoderma gracile]